MTPQNSNTDLSLEKPVETAMLMSLAGAGCVMANQWHCKLGENAATFNTLMKGRSAQYDVLIKGGFLPPQMGSRAMTNYEIWHTHVLRLHHQYNYTWKFSLFGGEFPN